MREWSCLYRAPYIIKTDNGPSYREQFEEECKTLGIKVIHSSSYNSQSQGLIESCMGIWKEQLKKSRFSLSQLQTDKLVYCLKSKETDHNQGSALTRFIGCDSRQKLPNSVDRSVNIRELIVGRQVHREKRGEKKRKDWSA